MSLAILETAQAVATRWRFSYILGCLLALTLAFAPRADAGFIGYYDIGNWMQLNTLLDGTPYPAGNGMATTADSGATVLVVGSNSGDGGTSSKFDFLITAPTAGTVMFTYTYTSLDTLLPCDPGPCDQGAFVVNGVFMGPILGTSDAQVTSPTTFSFSVNAGDVFGFEVDSADNSGEPGNLTLSNFSAPAPLSVPEPGTAGMLGLGAAAAASVWRRLKSRR